jgi:hypothetical protein
MFDPETYLEIFDSLALKAKQNPWQDSPKDLVQRVALGPASSVNLANSPGLFARQKCRTVTLSEAQKTTPPENKAFFARPLKHSPIMFAEGSLHLPSIKLLESAAMALYKHPFFKNIQPEAIKPFEECISLSDQASTGEVKLYYRMGRYKLLDGNGYCSLVFIDSDTLYFGSINEFGEPKDSGLFIDRKNLFSNDPQLKLTLQCLGSSFKPGRGRSPNQTVELSPEALDSVCQLDPMIRSAGRLDFTGSVCKKEGPNGFGQLLRSKHGEVVASVMVIFIKGELVASAHAAPKKQAETQARDDEDTSSRRHGYR